MEQNIDDIQTGKVMLVVKNEDGSFSPIGIIKNQAMILNRLLVAFSEIEPFKLNKDVKLKIEK